MATFEEVLAELAKTEGGEEKVDAIKERLSKVNLEAQGLRKRAKKFEGFEEKSKKYDDLLVSFEDTDFNLDGNIGEQLEAMNKNQNENKAKSSKMEKEFGKMQSRLTTMEEKNVRLETSKKKGAIKDRLSKAFNDGIYNPGITLDYRITNGDFFINDDEQVAYKRGDEEVTKSIFEAYTKDHKDEVRVNHKKGPGGKPYSSNNSAGHYSEDQLKNMTTAEFVNLSEKEQEQVTNSVNQINN